MITFDEKEHAYYNEYGVRLISVTQLMQKHGLAPNYDSVSKLVLEAKAQRGSLIHQEIDEYLTSGEVGFTAELVSFIEWLKKHSNVYKVVDHEFIVNNDIVAGRADLLLKDEMPFLDDDVYVIADFKTTSSIHFESVSWQLSIYAYLSSYEVKEGKVFWFKKDGSLEVKDIKLKSKEEVERLFECERNFELYQVPVVIDDANLVALEEVEAQIKYYENLKKEAEDKASEMREAIINAMEANGLKSFENDRIKLTYTAPSERVSIDSTRLKKEKPEIFAEYQKISKVKAGLRITLKEE